MKLDELVQLDELSLRDAAKYGIKGATALVGTAMLASSAYKAMHHEPETKVQSKVEQVTKLDKSVVERQVALASLVTKKYKVKPEAAWKIVDLATEHEDQIFPKAEDILAIIGIESSFNQHAKSQLKHDPAIGLMQVRPGVWGIEPHELSTPEEQIEKGAEILKSYFDKLGSVKAAVHAYNVGITNFKKNKNLNPGYVAKYAAERAIYEETSSTSGTSIS